MQHLFVFLKIYFLLTIFLKDIDENKEKKTKQDKTKKKT